MPKDAVLVLFACFGLTTCIFRRRVSPTSCLGLYKTLTAIVTSLHSLGVQHVHSNLGLKLAIPLSLGTKPNLLPRTTMLCPSSRIVYLCGDSLAVSPVCYPDWASLQPWHRCRLVSTCLHRYPDPISSPWAFLTLTWFFFLAVRLGWAFLITWKQRAQKWGCTALVTTHARLRSI